MGLVSQEPALFNDTIRANIAYGKDGQATESEIIAAAELANAHKFISSALQVSFFHPVLSRNFNVAFVCSQLSTKTVAERSACYLKNVGV